MNPTILYSIVTVSAGVVVLAIKSCFKSKCSNVSICCGLIKIERDIDGEIEEDKIETKRSTNRSDSIQNFNNV